MGARSGAYGRQRDAAGRPAALRFGVDGGQRPDVAQCDAVGGLSHMGATWHLFNADGPTVTRDERDS